MTNIIKDEICKIVYPSSLVNVEKYHILDIDGQIAFNFSFINSSKTAISKLVLCIVCYSEDNERIGIQQNVQIILNQEKVESSFSSNENILCDFPKTKIIVPLISSIYLLDGQEIKNDLSKLQPIKINPELIEEYNGDLKDVLVLELESRKIPYKKYVFNKYNEFWQCTCGAVNNQTTCNCCGTNKALLDFIFNEEKLNEKKAKIKEKQKEEIANEHLEELPLSAIDNSSEEPTTFKLPDPIVEEQDNKKKASKKKKIIAISLPIAAVLIIAITLCSIFIPRSIEEKNNELLCTLDNFNYETSGEEIIITGIKEIPENGKVIIPDSVTSIGDDAFEDCRGLTSVVIPDSVTSIGYGVFSYCSGLTNIVIPDCVTTIKSQAFNNCNALKTINFSGTKAEWNAIAKDNYWDENTSNYSIICIDGTITK